MINILITGALGQLGSEIQTLSSSYPNYAFLFTTKNELDMDYVLFALDSKGKNFRHTLDPNYKANRSEAPEDLKKQLPISIEWVKKMGALI
ncbi:MAG: hypothetical protein J0647_02420 [Campylobacteraceae bacterium]|nr:hypothetical protein [Campylobacteraceae bacterium]